MGDLQNPKLLWLKGGLFLLLGIVAGGLILLRTADAITALLLALTVWAFCRCYYFAFYVIEHYVDAGFRFSGLFDFLKYALTKRHNRCQPHGDSPDESG